MKLIEKLLNNSYQDTQLLIGNDEKGDNFSISRDVDFILKCIDENTALTTCNFINDNQYGNAIVEKSGDMWIVRVVIYMPVTQNLICSVSALMQCVAQLFSIEYDGWGCVLQK